MSAVLLDGLGREVEQRAVTPRRVRLTRASLDRLAELAGVPSPAAQMVASTGSLSGLGERLGGLGTRSGVGAEPDAGADASAASGDDPGAGLVAAGLVRDGSPTEEGGAVLTVWHAPALAVEVEMLVVLRRGRVRVRSWHRNLDDWVVCLSTADGDTFELVWLSAEDWWLELGRAAYVDTTGLAVPATSTTTGTTTGATSGTTSEAVPLPDVIETPWDLLLATGEAVQRGRHELLDQMVSDYSGLTLAGGPEETLEVADDGDVRRWHEQLESAPCGRLHAAVMGRSERGRPGAGIVEWVLFHDGWRALTPFRRDGWAMVRIERTSPVDLPRELAVRAAEVTS